MKRFARSLPAKGAIAVFLLARLLLPPGPAPCSAQEVKVPADIQLDFLRKILVFDRSLKAGPGTEIVIGVLYQGLYRASLTVKDEFIGAAEKPGDTRADGLAVRCVAIDLQKAGSLEAALAENRIDVLYVAPLRAFDVVAIAAATRKRKILSAAAVPDYVRLGLTVAIDAVGGRPKIVINMSGAEAEGRDFSSRLLNLAQVIR